MALKYAIRIMFKVVAIGRGKAIAADTQALGVHIYIDNREEDAAILNSMGDAQAIVTTIDHTETVSTILAGFAPEGRLVRLNPAKNPLQVPAGLLGGDQRSIFGSITGTPYDNKKSAEFQPAGEREAAH